MTPPDAATLKLDEVTLQLCEAKLGPDHDDTLCSMHNLGLSYAALGRHAERTRTKEKRNNE